MFELFLGNLMKQIYITVIYGFLNILVVILISAWGCYHNDVTLCARPSVGPRVELGEWLQFLGGHGEVGTYQFTKLTENDTDNMGEYKPSQLYMTAAQGLVDFGAALKTISGYGDEGAETRHFVSDVISDGVAEQFELTKLTENDTNNMGEYQSNQLYMTDAQGQVDFGAALKTISGYGDEGAETRHFVSNVISGGLAEQFGMKSGDQLLLLNYISVCGKTRTEVTDLFREERVEVGLYLAYQRPKDSTGTGNQSFECFQATGIVMKTAEQYSVVQTKMQALVTQFGSWITMPPTTVYIMHPQEDRSFHMNGSNMLSARDSFSPTPKFSFEMILQVNPDTSKTRVFFRHHNGNGKYYFTHRVGSHIQAIRVLNLMGHLPSMLEPEYLINLRAVSNASRLFALEVEELPGNYVTLDKEQIVVDEASSFTVGDDQRLHFRITSFLTKSGELSIPSSLESPSTPTSQTPAPAAASKSAYNIQCCPCILSLTCSLLPRCCP